MAIANKVNEYRKSILKLNTKRTRDWCRNVYNTKCNITWKRCEDNLLTELVQKHGKQWGLISNQMTPRTPQQCLARWEKLYPSISDKQAFKKLPTSDKKKRPHVIGPASSSKIPKASDSYRPTKDQEPLTLTAQDSTNPFLPIHEDLLGILMEDPLVKQMEGISGNPDNLNGITNDCEKDDESRYYLPIDCFPKHEYC